MKSSPARPPSHALGTARWSPRQMSRSNTRHATSSGMMGATLVPSLSRASGACHQAPHVTLPTHPTRAVVLLPSRPPQVTPLRRAANRSARYRRDRPPTCPQGPWSTPDSRATPSGTLPPSFHTMGHTTDARSRCDGSTPQTATTRRVSHALGFAPTCPHRCTRNRLHFQPRHTHHRAPPQQGCQIYEIHVEIHGNTAWPGSISNTPNICPKYMHEYSDPADRSTKKETRNSAEMRCVLTPGSSASWHHAGLSTPRRRRRVCR